MSTIILGLIVLGILFGGIIICLPMILRAIGDALLDLFFTIYTLVLLAGAVFGSIQFDFPLNYTVIFVAILLLGQVGLYLYFKFKLVLQKEKQKSGDAPYLEPED